MNRGTIRRLALLPAPPRWPSQESGSSGVSASVPPDTTEVSAAEPNEAVAGFELAPYIREHVESGETLQVSSTSPMISPVPYTEAQRVGVEQAVEELGVDAELQGPPTGAAEDQVGVDPDIDRGAGDRWSRGRRSQR